MSYDANAAYNSDDGVPGHGTSGGYGEEPLGASSPDDLSLPLYGATFGQAIKRFFKNYVNFKGRASRSEYWFAYLFTQLLSIIPAILYTFGRVGEVTSQSMALSGSSAVVDSSGGAIGMGTVGGLLLLLISLATLLPNLAITWRRLHDANLAGPFYFFVFVPFVGWIILLIFTISPSKPEGQRFDA